MIRKPIITVQGHVDAGKTRFLDSIRGTAIVEKEAGGITQHIGATEVPIDVIKKISGDLLKKYGFDLKIPGLLFIDTPGHEAFTNLRKRGGVISDLAVLVVDISKGCQNQTYEAIEILKTYKCPFIVAANKIDGIHGYQTKKGSVLENQKNQTQDVLTQVETKIYELVGQLYEKGFQADKFDNIQDFTKYIPIVPICAKSGEGIPEILMFLSALSQKYLEKKLEIHVDEPGKGTLLEVKEERGLGKTIDVILYEGKIRVGDEIAVGTKDGVIKTKVRALLEPKPLDEMRSPSERFANIKILSAAAGVKISAPNLDNALAGSPLRVVKTGNEEQEVLNELENVKIESESIGPIIKSDSIGSLEALIKLLQEKNVKIKKADVGEVTRRDIMEIEPVKNEDPYKGVILAFHTKINNDALEEADKREVKIFKNNIIYKLLEDYEEWVETEKNKEKQEKIKQITHPAKVTILPNHTFRNTKPAIVGVRILTGKIKKGTELMNKEGEIVGKINAIQNEGKQIEEAKEEDEVAISIQGATVGKTINEKEELYSFIPQKQWQKLSEITDEFSDKEITLIEEIKKMQSQKAEA